MYFVGMVSKELIAASTQPLLLSILVEGENYGYALIQRIRELSQDNIQWTEGMLYPVLHRLEQQGLIDSEWKVSESGKKRKYYRIKQAGHKALQSDREQWTSVHNTFAQLWKIQPRSI
jgi:DNA-binding PadR family transcriptional regulator